MTPTDRHARITALFHEALEQPPAERVAWLGRTCGDADLRANIAAMLEAHLATDGFLEQPFLARTKTGGTAENLLNTRAQGQRIGPWQIEERLGAGGMGVVYRATRADGLYTRTVALKLLAPNPLLSSGDVLARRLAAERQILARLEHDGIARLYDGGVTEEGLPYLALELVNGEPITDYADRHGLSAVQRADLFAQACDAVAYAHRNLVVHRDLKPAHILVTDGGAGAKTSVKLLDFGVSALLGDPTGDGLTLPTVPHALTPSYAAPEQVRGEPITTAADVYALGVVLYELLGGQRPYDLSGKTASEVERLVAEVEPSPPSTVASPERARTLSGDLDTIVMKALAKEPERRYASAEALAADLRRHLRGLPVEARPATAGYRLNRFVRRHRVGIATTAAVLLLAVTLIGFYTARLAAERDRTTEALTRTEGTLAFLEDTILSGEPVGGDYDTPLRAVLDSAATRVDAIEDPAVASAIRFSLASVYNAQGRPEEAEILARSALSFYEPDDPGVRPAMITNLIAMTLRNQRKPEEALLYHAEAIDRLRAAAAAGEDMIYELSSALNERGATFFNLEDFEQAAEAYSEAVELRRSMPASEFRADHLTPLHNLAVLMANQGEYDEAARLSSEMAAMLRPREEPAARYMLAFALYNWATALNNLGLADSAAVIRRQGIEVGDAALGEDHPDMNIDRIALVSDLHVAGQLDEAAREGEAVLARVESTLGDDHSYTAWARVAVGSILCDANDAVRGTALVRRGLRDRRRLLPEGHRRIPESENLLGHCLARLGRMGEARELLEGGYHTLLSDFGPEYVETQRAGERLRAFYESTGQRDEAATLSPSS